MLETIERVLIVVADRAEATSVWRNLFGAVTVGDSTSEALNARFTTMRAGGAEFEFHEPLGPGPAASQYKRWGPGLLGVGFGTRHYDHVIRQISGEGLAIAKEGERLVVTADQAEGMFSVITPIRAESRPGLVDNIYEVTLLSEHWSSSAAELTRIFGLDTGRFLPVTSEAYNCEGTLAMFNPGQRLDRIAVMTPIGEGAMKRLFDRRGPTLYMCSVESDDVAALAARLDRFDAKYAYADDAAPERGLFVHPSSAMGVLVGVSRTNHAWTWSGNPDRATAPTSA